MKLHTNDESVTRIALAAFPSYKGKKFQLVSLDPDGTFTFSGNYWDGGTRHEYKLLRLDTLETRPILGQNPLQNAESFTAQIPPNGAVVEHVIFCGKDMGLRVYVREENITKLLPTGDYTLDRDEKIVLAATAGLKAFARFSEAEYYTKITRKRYDSTKERLIGRGLLNKKGAITNDGRNAIGDVRLGDIQREIEKEWEATV